VLSLELPETDAEELVGYLAAHALGAEFGRPIASRTRVRIFLRSSRLEAAALAVTRTFLRGSALDPAECGLRVERLDDRRWAERYQAALRPFALGRRFLVLPGGQREAGSERVPIRLVPSRAFGTGEHPTTQLCVEGLEERVRPGSRWLDLGCGTGVLSVVAHHCGAGEVLGIDHDGEAVAVAREVLRANGLDGRIGLRRGTTGDGPGGAWDGVVANIGAAFFREGAGELSHLLAPGGLLLASGFLVEDLEAVGGALERVGIVEVGRRERAPWALLVAARIREATGARQAEPPGPG
jgi:ribosomal protein L11 methyltransferase